MNNVCKREGKDRWQHMAVKVSGSREWGMLGRERGDESRGWGMLGRERGDESRGWGMLGREKGDEVRG